MTEEGGVVEVSCDRIEALEAWTRLLDLWLWGDRRVV
jgi:hypothetical protein